MRLVGVPDVVDVLGEVIRQQHSVLRLTVLFWGGGERTGRFCCVHVFGSAAMLQHLVSERMPLRKLRKNMFYVQNALWTGQVSVNALPYMGCVALLAGTSWRTLYATSGV